MPRTARKPTRRRTGPEKEGQEEGEEEGQEEGEQQEKEEQEGLISNPNEYITSLCINKDETILYTGNNHGDLQAWDLILLDSYLCNNIQYKRLIPIQAFELAHQHAIIDIKFYQHFLITCARYESNVKIWNLQFRCIGIIQHKQGIQWNFNIDISQKISNYQQFITSYHHQYEKTISTNNQHIQLRDDDNQIYIDLNEKKVMKQIIDKITLKF